MNSQPIIEVTDFEVQRVANGFTVDVTGYTETAEEKPYRFKSDQTHIAATHADVMALLTKYFPV